MSEEVNVAKQSEHESPKSGLSSSTVSKSVRSADDSGASPFKWLLQVVLPIIVGAGLLYYFFGPKKDSGAKKADRMAPVTVASAQRQAVPIEIRTTGNVQAYSVINVIPQVGGQLLKVCFTQGDFVKKGQLLFQIDPRPFQAAYDEALGNVAKDKAQIVAAQAALSKDQAQVGTYKANLARDTAQLSFSKVEKSRYKELVGQGAVSNEQSDQMTTNESSADATVNADKETIKNGEAVVEGDRAQIATAKGTLEVDEAAARSALISLQWCQIRSPMDGRTSTLNVYEGNVVTANSTQTPLMTIAQIQPIYISFSVPEEYLTVVRRCLNARTLKVKALIEGLRSDTVLGNASFLEYTVNTTSGTALLRATFPNMDNRLYPGQFVDVIVTMPPDGDSIVVPANAVQTTQQGNSVYVVQSDSTVNLVRVDLKRTYGDWAAIAQGISAGDVVVTDGQLALTPGAKVKIIKSEQTPSHRAGPAAGSVSSGTPMNSMGDQSGDSNAMPFSGNQGSNSTDSSGDSLAGSSSASSQSAPIKPSQDVVPGKYGPSATPSPTEAKFSPRGAQGRHQRAFNLGEEHGGAPLNVDNAPSLPEAHSGAAQPGSERQSGRHKGRAGPGN
jgi:membrane fusion protein, multidrug efflux system